MNLWHPSPPTGVGFDDASFFRIVAVSNSLCPQDLVQCLELGKHSLPVCGLIE